MFQQPEFEKYLLNGKRALEGMVGQGDVISEIQLTTYTSLWNTVQESIPNETMLQQATDEERAQALGRFYGVSALLGDIAFQWGMSGRQSDEEGTTSHSLNLLVSDLNAMNWEIRKVLGIGYENVSGGGLALFNYPEQGMDPQSFKRTLPFTPEELFKRAAVDSYIVAAAPVLLAAVEQIPADQQFSEIDIMRSCLKELVSGEVDRPFGVIQMLTSEALPEVDDQIDAVGTLPGSKSRRRTSYATWGLDHNAQYRRLTQYPQLQATLLFGQARSNFEVSARGSAEIKEWYGLIGSIANHLSDNMQVRIRRDSIQHRVSEFLYVAASGRYVAENLSSYDADFAAECSYYLHNPLALETLLIPDESRNAFAAWNRNRLEDLYRTTDTFDEADAAYEFAVDYLKDTIFDDNAVIESLATESDYQSLQNRDFYTWMRINGYDTDLARLGSDEYAEAYRSYGNEYLQALEQQWRTERLEERTETIERWASIRDSLPEGSSTRRAMQHMLDYSSQFMVKSIPEALLNRMEGNLNHSKMNLLLKFHLGSHVRAWGYSQMYFSDTSTTVHNSEFPGSRPSTIIAEFDVLSGQYLAFNQEHMNPAMAAKYFFGPEDPDASPGWRYEHENIQEWADFHRTVISMRRALGLATSR